MSTGLFKLPLPINKKSMTKKVVGIELLKNNFQRVEEKFMEFFEKGEPRWPSEKHDFLRNHHKNLDNFFITNISLEKLAIADLPENIVREVHLAYDAFQKGEDYN
jgi:hypothetical protein